jgi:hypothetical protein
MDAVLSHYNNTCLAMLHGVRICILFIWNLINGKQISRVHRCNTKWPFTIPAPICWPSSRTMGQRGVIDVVFNLAELQNTDSNR